MAQKLIFLITALLLALLSTSGGVRESHGADRRVSGRVTRIIQQSVEMTPGFCYDKKATCDTPRRKPISCCQKHPKFCCP